MYPAKIVFIQHTTRVDSLRNESIKPMDVSAIPRISTSSTCDSKWLQNFFDSNQLMIKA